VTLALADNPNKKDTNKAVTSLTPHPPTLIGILIEKRIKGVKTRKEK
tara:strand:+ start:234 stop:374 length:141 start_codon:yes stop_codon:yes gene_type:complete